MRPPFATGDQLELGNLREYWKVLATELSELDELPALDRNRLLSARAFDESQVSGPRTYMEVDRYLSVARDNHEALLALLSHRGASLWAPWSLLRPIFETSFLAAWILDPEDGRERRARGLRCEVVDYYQQRRHRSEFKAFPEMSKLIAEREVADEQSSLHLYRSEAAQLGLRFEQVHQSINVIDELPKLSFVRGSREFTPFLKATWRLLSGYEHGLGWALLKGSQRRAGAKIPGGMNVELVIDDSEFVNAAKSTYFLFLSACRILKRRHLEPSQG
ncbi:hypothetical protein GCM10010168_50610 [Actinoplanes ianthinogenes]|uniref:Uncharacterized protein n=1 Tax=Actinoplanes ianthinogenes TaxID=122358 RepID=A0ABN6CPP6_9ACTN|nr:hypothetical protein [Actinoplanes ianthinogenes]BCJ46112.1 hypothetical protein Aiant_67690 [Actinoplanes ianthinogenes]GGR26318.1 hypothetical protein GCM10010168_50610 [Actinoplanes ianthinogenes]